MFQIAPAIFLRRSSISGRMIPLDTIFSRENSVVKHVRKLKIKKYRQKNNQFMIEGVRFVKEALISDAPIRYCLCSAVFSSDEDVRKLLDDILKKGIKIYIVDENLLKDICDTETPQGIVAVIDRVGYDINQLIKESDLIVIVDRIQDPGNLGTIIRTADAAGAKGVILSEGTVDVYNPKVLRSTMGSIFHIPVAMTSDLIDAVEKLKKQGFTIYASSLEGSIAYYDEAYTGKTAIIIGNEAQGIESSLMLRSDKLIKIPMHGLAESLNAAVAAGIILFEVVKKKLKNIKVN